MHCPFCSTHETKVVDSRINQTGDTTRRRRECAHCGGRFTTYEKVEELMPLIIKKDGRRETFEREKLLGGIRKACQKREISLQKIDDSVQRIEKRLHACGLKEVPSKVLGEMVMSELHQLDKVAYVRFASVYREFRDVEEFVADLQGPEPQALDAPTGHPSFPFLQKSEVPADSQPTS